MRPTHKSRLTNDAVAQAEWAEKKWVWTEHKDEGYVAAVIVKEQGEQLTLEFGDGKVGCVAWLWQ